MTLQQAIARQEGFGLKKSLATLNHNPGNIVFGIFATFHGATGNVHGYAVFPDDATGWAALTALLNGPAYHHLTVEQAVNRYCPSDDGTPLTWGNQPSSYVRNVCRWLGVSPNTPILGLLAEKTT